MTDDTQQLSPTPSDDVRPRPTESDTVRPSPTMSATRTEAHSLTTREVMKIFEAAGIPRAQRSIERYCQQGDLDCLPDAIERRQYITRESVDTLIGQLKELAARHQQASAEQMSTTPDDTPRQPPTDDAMKHGTPEKRDEKHAAGEDDKAVEAMKARIKELEVQNLNLEIGKRASEQFVGMLREEITQQVQVFSTQLTQTSRRVGQLETEMRLLKAPDRDRHATRDDSAARDGATPIDAEFIEESRTSHDGRDNVQTNHASQP